MPCRVVGEVKLKRDELLKLSVGLTAKVQEHKGTESFDLKLIQDGSRAIVRLFNNKDVVFEKNLGVMR